MKNMLKKISKNNKIEEKSKEIAVTDDKMEFFNIISEIARNETVKKMKDYKQHCDTSCYTHCMHVAYYSYVIAKKLGLDYKSTARAAMLHDLFLYDWRMKFRDPKHYGFHAFVHPKIALENAMKIFDLNEKEKDIIVKHMWPATLPLPKYKESYIVTIMDKYSAIRETYMYYLSKIRRRAIYRLAYVSMSLLIVIRVV